MIVGQLKACFPKDFLRVWTKLQPSDSLMTLAKRFFEKLLIESKRFAFCQPC